nr:hypothetical protein [Tanacetum cinerariifolium]
ASPTINTASGKDGTFQRTYDAKLGRHWIFDDAYDDIDAGAEADYNNLETVIPVNLIPSTRIHKDQPKEQIIGEVNSAIQTRKLGSSLSLLVLEPLQRTQKAIMLPQTSVPQNLGADKAVNQEKGDRVESVITTNSSLEAAQDKGHTSRSGEDRLEENIELTDTVPIPHDSPLTGGYTPGSDKGRITLVELMETCTTLSNRVTQLENELSTTKDVYNKAFITLTNRVKKLESQLK